LNYVKQGVANTNWFVDRIFKNCQKKSLFGTFMAKSVEKHPKYREIAGIWSGIEPQEKNLGP
jgi:hypothetical protein